MTDPEVLVPLLGPFLARQRWFPSPNPPSSVSLWHSNVKRRGWPALIQLIVDADGGRYHLLVGLRSAGSAVEFVSGRDDHVLGELDTSEGRALAYDAVVDHDLAIELLGLVAPGESASHVRLLGGEQSNTSLVYDDRLILKLFRRLHPGPNRDVEVTQALAAAGFTHVAAPLGRWTHQGDDRYDLAVIQPYLAGGVDGWALALTSLRDFFGVHDTQSVPIITDVDTPPPSSVGPEEAGGDFSGEASRLGEVTAAMHVALAEAFGQGHGDAPAWATTVEAQVKAMNHPAFRQERALAVVERARRVDDAGAQILVHGDYHLGQVMRADAGWFILDFEGEPARPPEDRDRPSSPLRDVAGMLRSFHYASAVAAMERGESCEEPAMAWESRNRAAFLDGYLPAAEKAGVIPANAEAVEALLAVFELEKAVYELAYERAHRPQWEAIPLAALRRITGGPR